jgi:hypothetical protein
VKSKLLHLYFSLYTFHFALKKPVLNKAKFLLVQDGLGLPRFHLIFCPMNPLFPVRDRFGGQTLFDFWISSHEALFRPAFGGRRNLQLPNLMTGHDSCQQEIFRTCDIIDL